MCSQWGLSSAERSDNYTKGFVHILYENAKKFCAFQTLLGRSTDTNELFVRPSKVKKTKIMMAAITDFGIDFSINGSP